MIDDSNNLHWAESEKSRPAPPPRPQGEITCSTRCAKCWSAPLFGGELIDGLCPTCRRAEKCVSCGRPTEPGEACCSPLVETRTEDGPWVRCEWSKFVVANRDALDAVELGRILDVVNALGTYRGGGGAAPVWEIRMATCDHPDCDEVIGHDGPHTWSCDDGSCCEPGEADAEQVAYVREQHFGARP